MRMMAGRLGAALRVIAVNAALLIGALLLFEVGCRVAGIAPDTLKPNILTQFGAPAAPRGYFAADPATGFDIARNAPATPFFVEGVRHTIFSNRYGCFDERTSYPGDYLLLLGDSFAWGFAEYRDKWGTILEERLGIAVAKCGISLSGQRHQALRGARIVGEIGHRPRAIVVSHFENDYPDDALFPQATVHDGYLATLAAFRPDGSVQRLSPADVEERYRRWLAGDHRAQDIAAPAAPGIVYWIARNSVAANVVKEMTRQLGVVDLFLSLFRPGAAGADRTGADGGPDRIRDLSRDAHFAAIRGMKAWAAELGVPLYVVLVANRDRPAGQNDEVLRFLRAENIEALDLAPAFAGKASLYWKMDGHWNADGNRAAAEATYRWLAGKLKGL